MQELKINKLIKNLKKQDSASSTGCLPGTDKFQAQRQQTQEDSCLENPGCPS